MSLAKSGQPTEVQGVAQGEFRIASMRVLLIAALALIAAVLFWPTTQSLIRAWEDTEALTYTHGYLIVLVSVWLLLRDRAALQVCTLRANYRAAIAVAGLSVMWLIAYRAGVELLHQLLLPLIAWMAVWAALGRPTALRCLFAFAFLYFAIPIWSIGNDFLQDATVIAVRMLIGATGVSAVVVDNFVHIPAGVFEIAGGCSGLHFFIVALAVAALYGEIGRDGFKGRLLLLALAAALAMLTNWIRVFTIIVAGYLTDMQHFLVRVDHYYFGWVLFMLTLLAFFAIARRLPLRDAAPNAASGRDVETKAPIKGFAAAVLAMAIGPAWSFAAPNEAPGRLTSDWALPTDLPGWTGPLQDHGLWRPQFPQADLQQLGLYHGESATASVYLAVYERQHHGKELVGYGNSVLGDLRGAAVARRSDPGFAVNEVATLESGGRESLIWYYYRVGSRSFVRGFPAQLYYAAASLSGQPPSALVAARIECEPDCESARLAHANLMEALDASLRSNGTSADE